MGTISKEIAHSNTAYYKLFQNSEDLKEVCQRVFILSSVVIEDKACEASSHSNFFNDSDADVFINGIYNNNGVNIDVPIKITNTSVMIGNSDTFNKYGICYCYSVLKNNIIKVIHKPRSADDKYNMIR